MSGNESSADRLIQAIAETLNISASDILLFDSFRDLGGDEESAEKVRIACRSKGLNVSGQDILDCLTLAELQTRVTPQAQAPADHGSQIQPLPLTLPLRGISVSSHSTSHSDSLGTFTCSSANSEDEKEQEEQVETNVNGRATGALVGSVDPNLESLLQSFPSVSSACIVKPKAGPFDGQLVALIKIDSCTGLGLNPNTEPEQKLNLHDRNRSRSCISPFEFDLVKQEISLLRMAVQECPNPPQIWIPFDADFESPRHLQTWVQNMDDDTYKDVLKLQIPVRRRRATRRKSAMPTLNTENVDFFGLSPMQRLRLQAFTTQNEGLVAQSERCTQSLMLNVKGGAEPSDVDAAIEAIVARHDMLRARFRRIQQEWVQCVQPEPKKSYRLTRHVDVNENEMLALINDAEEAINPIDGPVFAAMYIHNQDRQMLHLVAHQLVVDPLSWRIILSDLEELLQKGTLLSEGSVSFSHWIEYQNRQMAERIFEPTLPFDVFSANLEYWDMDQRSNTYGNSGLRPIRLTPEQSHALEQSAAQVFRTDVADILLAALLLSFCQTFPDRGIPTLWKQDHGRDAIEGEFNIVETVGWFASLCPIGVDVDSTTDLIEVITQVKDTRRTVPRGGVPFFASEFSNSEGTAANIPLEIVFKSVDTARELQQQNGLLEPVSAPGGTTCLKSDSGPGIGRMALFEVSSTIDHTGGQIDVVYSRTCKYQEKIETWMQIFEFQILEAIAKLENLDPQLTLSDIPLIQSSYQSLERLGSDRCVNVKDIETIYPITPAQQEILVAQAEKAETFHVHAIYEMTGLEPSVDVRRLCAAWEAIVTNTPALRSIFIDSVSRDGLFDQVVLKKISPNILFIETADPDEAVAALPALNMSSSEPRHRLSVCYSPSRMVVRLDASQVLCDLTSLHLLMTELSHVYSGRDPYHDVSLHNTYLHQIASMDTAYSLQVWKTGLSQVKPCNFPPLSTSAKDSFHNIPYDLDVTQAQMEAFCQQNEVDAGAVFQLAWALVLRAFIGMDSVVFGYQFDARDGELLCGIEQLVGSFATILPCSIELAAEKSLKECLAVVGEAFNNASKHDNLTMSEVQHALGLKDKSLFNTCLYFQNYDELDAGDELMLTLITSGRKTDCDLSLTLMFLDGRLHGNFAVQYLSSNQIQSVMSSYYSALTHIMEHTETSVAETDLLTDRDYAQLVVQDWELAQQSQKVSTCLHDVIFQHVLYQPDAPAVCSWDGDITYLQLASLVSRLRTYLVNLGVGPGTVVPIVLDKNRWAPVIMLAVLQAGAAFVALDSQDSATVKSTIDHLNPHVVLATETAWKDLSSLAINLVIINDTFFAMLTPYLSTLVKDASPDHAACIFVTPKKSRSIFFTHASLLSTFISQGSALKMNSDSRVLQLSAYNVDISLVETLGTLVHGGCVCIPSANERVNDISGAMTRMEVTWSYMTSVIARKIHPDSVPSLRTLCFRTRKLDPDTYMPWLQDHDILLAYGAPDICPLGISVTEVSMDSSLDIISPPVTGRFWVLNPDDPKKLMSFGAIGELAIDSPLVTPHRFTLDRPLIAPEPSYKEGERPRSRYLKTGHRVRYLDDGNVQFISSVRDEVRVGGLMVDVAQVEQILRRCLNQGIDVVVDTVTTRDSGPLLAAFLQLGPKVMQPYESLNNLSPETKERLYIAKKMLETSLENPTPQIPRLARHCIPSVFIPVRAFPMSTSLKVNRRKLQRMVSEMSCDQILHMSRVPNPGEIQRVVLSQKPLPLTEPEEVMREIWADVVGVSVSAVKGSSSFSSIGGNKFLASLLVVSCRKAGLCVSLTDLLKDATLTEICRAAETSSKKTSVKEPVARKLDPRFVKEIITPQLHCSTSEVLDFTEASSQQVRGLELGIFNTRADIVCLAIRFNGPIDPTRLEAACSTLSKMHAILNVAFISHEHRVYQVHCASFKPPFIHMSCATDALDDATYNIVKEHQSLPFNPAAPITQFTFFDAEYQGSLVIRLSKSHIDDVSAHLLIHELVALYEGDDTHDIPRSSYLDYTRASRVSRQQGLEYWTGQLENAKMTKVIATTRPVPPASLTEIRTLKQTTSLGHLAPYGMPPDAALKAAWAIVLSTISGSHDVLFGEVIQTSSVDIVGPMTNTIPVRVQFPSKHSTPLDLMNCVQLQRQSHSQYDTFGIQEIVSNCTDWRSCTQFSTVVQHHVPGPRDGSSTLNIDGATFTYRLIESWTKDFPDIFVRSTIEANDRITLEIKYSEERLHSSFAQSCLSLLIAAWETVTHHDTIHQPMIHSAEEIARTECQIPFHVRQPTPTPPIESVLDTTQRKEIQESIVGAWNKIMKPSASGVPKSKHPTIPFYTISKSILPAYALTAELNSVLPVTVTVDDILAHPSMHTQLELVGQLLPPKHDGFAALLRPKSKVGPDRSTTTALRNGLRSLKPKNSKLTLKVGWMKSKQPAANVPASAPPAITETPIFPRSPIPTIVVPEVGYSDIPASQPSPMFELEGGSVNLGDRRSSGGSSYGSVEEVCFSPVSMTSPTSVVSPVSFSKDRQRVPTWESVFEAPLRVLSPLGYRNSSK
ncbi:non-ribosomal peptide synthetase [Fusarium heterosporum]|uniref:Non-ribosomal peptide synthetase n=1 Tax=Fusarium heterosporum TaxID=42747 RepID=A0A8H5SZ29_FUSHE|nr:non-ribosomal peptide synthetase [Fusarium heterosporum]